MTASNGRGELLERYGRFYGDEHFALAFTAGTTGMDAKRVTTKGWDQTSPVATGDFGAALVKGRGVDHNVAVVLRPSNLIVIECDSEDDLIAVEELDLPTTLTVQSSEPYKRHFYFRPPEGMDALPYVAFRFETLRVTADAGRYFLAPPSIHPSGVQYSFLKGLGPGDTDIVELPEEIYRGLVERSRREDSEQRERIAVDPDAKISAGQRRETLFRYACMLRRWGRPYEAILAECLQFNAERCDPPVSPELVEVQVKGAMKKDGDQELAGDGTATMAPQINVVGLEQFAAQTEESATPLMGQPNDSLLPSEGLLLMYGDGGAGKTTLTVDAVTHLAAGATWIGVEIPQPTRVLLIENEGPRGPFRETLAHKMERWHGGPFAPNVRVLEEPWAAFTLADPLFRQAIADEITEQQTQLVVVGPLASLGAKGSGTPDDVNEFAAMIADLRSRTEQPFALWIVHHENKAGDVSGAWERLPDTLVHVSARGNGHTQVNWRKVRWSSRMHGTSVTLSWDDANFTVDEKKERDYESELFVAMSTSDERWFTSRDCLKALKDISEDGKAANREKVEAALDVMREAGRLVYEVGPKGRHINARCYRLSVAQDAQSHTEPHDHLEGLEGSVARVARTVRESHRGHTDPDDSGTGPDTPSHTPPDDLELDWS